MFFYHFTWLKDTLLIHNLEKVLSEFLKGKFNLGVKNFGKFLVFAVFIEIFHDNAILWKKVISNL